MKKLLIPILFLLSLTSFSQIVGITDYNINIVRMTNTTSSAADSVLIKEGGSGTQKLSLIHKGDLLGIRSLNVNRIGTSAAVNNSSGEQNNAFGTSALFWNETGSANSAFGHQALLNMTNGGGNAGFGWRALYNQTAGNFNFGFGYGVDVPDLSGSNQLTIGNLIYGAGINGTGTTISTGNIGIGVKVPTASAILELGGTDKGFLAPRLTTAQRDAISSPATGLFIYNTTTNAFNYWDSDSWEAVGGGGGVTDHGALTGLSDDDHTIYALLAGRASGQTLNGGIAANEDLTLEGTSHATKTSSYVIIQPSGGDVAIGSSSSAGYRLNVVTAGSPAFRVQAANSNVSNPAMDFYDNGTGVEGIFTGNGTNLYVGTYSNHPVQFGTNANVKMTIAANGNITIGVLDTDLTAPTTSGTTRTVITDANGLLSFITTPSDTHIGNTDLTLTGTRSLSGASNSLDIGTNASKLSALALVSAGAIVVNGALQVSNSSSTDANYTALAYTTFTTLIEITANRDFTFPSQGAGKIHFVWNQNSSGNTWGIVGTVIDAAGNAMTTLVNDTFYMFFSNGTSWVKASAN